MFYRRNKHYEISHFVRNDSAKKGANTSRLTGSCEYCMFRHAAPVSIVIMRRYLEGFAYRVPLHIWVFAMALLAVMAITIAVVTLRSLRAATMNPVKSLRNE